MNRPPARIGGSWVNRVLLSLAGVAAAVAGWQLVSSLLLEQLPGPSAVAAAFVRLLLHEDPVFGRTLPQMVALSLWLVLRGAALGTVAGLGAGLLLGMSTPARAALRPLLAVVQPVPPLAWLPLAYVLFAALDRPSLWVQLFVVSVAVFFPVMSGTLQGVQYTPPVYKMVARTLGASRRQLISRIVFPAAFPSIIAGVRVGVGVGWMSIIAAEFVGGRTGIGFYIWNAYSIGGRVAEIVAGMLAIGVTGLAMNAALVALEKRRTPWL